MEISSIASFSSSPWLALYVIVGVIYVLVWLTLNWVGCRGEFMFLDNIVRNRAAISWPWRRYAHQGNVWFLFHLVLIVLSTVLFVGSAGIALALSWPWINEERAPQGNEVAILGGVLLIFSCLWIIYAAAVFLIRSFVIPLYFKQTAGLWAALRAVTWLTVSRPITIGAYLLVSLLLAIAGGVVSVLIFLIACCLICWLACVPCLGSLLLSFAMCQLILPILIYYRCFQLDCLAQFGPQYDVWLVDVPTTMATSPPLTPPPPPG